MDKVKIPQRISTKECDFLIGTLTTRQAFVLLGGVSVGLTVYVALSLPVLAKIAIASIPVWITYPLAKGEIKGYTVPEFLKSKMHYHLSPKTYSKGVDSIETTNEVAESGEGKQLGLSRKRFAQSNS